MMLYHLDVAQRYLVSEEHMKSVNTTLRQQASCFRFHLPQLQGSLSQGHHWALCKLLRDRQELHLSQPSSERSD